MHKGYITREQAATACAWAAQNLVEEAEEMVLKRDEWSPAQVGRMLLASERIAGWAKDPTLLDALRSEITAVIEDTRPGLLPCDDPDLIDMVSDEVEQAAMTIVTAMDRITETTGAHRASGKEIKAAVADPDGFEPAVKELVDELRDERDRSVGSVDIEDDVMARAEDMGIELSYEEARRVAADAALMVNATDSLGELIADVTEDAVRDFDAARDDLAAEPEEIDAAHGEEEFIQ